MCEYVVPIGFTANAGVGRFLFVATFEATSALCKEESEETSCLDAVVYVTDFSLAPGFAVTYTTVTCDGWSGGGRGRDLARRRADEGGRIGGAEGDGGAVTGAGSGLGRGDVDLFRARPFALHTIAPTLTTFAFNLVTYTAACTPLSRAIPRALFAAPFSSSCSG